MAPEEKARELRLHRSELTGKMLEAQVELSRIRKLWLVEGVQTPIAVRASLDHQLAELELKRHQLDRELAGIESARRAAIGITFHSLLVKALEDAGMGQLVRDVRHAAEDAQAAASRDHPMPATPPGAQPPP